VATILGIFFFFLLLPPLFKTTEGVVVGFQISAWAPKKNNRNSGKQKFDIYIICICIWQG
jgi:hypothetical protein